MKMICYVYFKLVLPEDIKVTVFDCFFKFLKEHAKLEEILWGI